MVKGAYNQIVLLDVLVVMLVKCYGQGMTEMNNLEESVFTTEGDKDTFSPQ